MNEPIFIDPAISRKSKILDETLATDLDGFPLPSIVEISESGTCNRVCAFCPRSAPGFKDTKEFIHPVLLKRLASQISDVGFKGMFLFSGFSEPLLDKSIFARVRDVRDRLPHNRIEMVTNGDALDRDRLLRLLDSGLSTILISVYDSEDAAKAFEDLCRDAGLDEGQFVIRPRYLDKKENFGITISNRAGMLENAAYSRPALSSPLNRPCYYPSYLFFMDYQGDVLICPHDWGKRMVIGNLNDQTFTRIWTSARAILVRRKLNQQDRNFSPCNVCDVFGTYNGHKHAEKWAGEGDYDLAEQPVD